MWVVAEILKARLNSGRPADLFHVRNQKGEEIDLLIDDGTTKSLIEVKSGKTVSSDACRSLDRYEVLLGPRASHGTWLRILVHGDTTARRRGVTELLPWREVGRRSW